MDAGEFLKRKGIDVTAVLNLQTADDESYIEDRVEDTRLHCWLRPIPGCRHRLTDACDYVRSHDCSPTIEAIRHVTPYS